MKLRKVFSSLNWAQALALFVLFSVEAGPAYAGSFESSDWIHESTYLGKISQKLGFGFLNITAGWTALFFEPARDQNFFVGIGKGIVYTFTNTAGGILHAATFPIPFDIPLPHGGIAYEYKR
ncbi:MAG: hypothetical protein WC484_01515 [Candidatus Omnitrophota bacterium]